MTGRGRVAGAVAVLAMGSACAPHPPAPPRPRPPAVAQAEGRAPPAQVLLPPAERCPRATPPAPRPSVVPDLAPLSVRAGPSGVTLEAGGASAGRVLIEIAAATGQAMRVAGAGASVRIYAHATDRPAQALIDAIARAAGLVVRREAGAPIAILDPAEAVREARSRRAAQIDLAPLETRLVPARHPAEIAPVLARLLLGCRGRIVSAPGRGMLIIIDFVDYLDRMEALIQALDAPQPLTIEMDLDRPPGPVTYGVPEDPTPSCGAIPEAPAPLLPDGRLYAAGEAAGDLLRRIAAARGRDIVVGCGGDRAAFFRGAADMEAGDVARHVGLAAIEGPASPETFTSWEIAARLRFLSVIRSTEGGPFRLRGFVAPHIEELAVAASAIAPRVAAVAYQPASMLIAAGRVEDVARVEALTKAWAEETKKSNGN